MLLATDLQPEWFEDADLLHLPAYSLIAALGPAARRAVELTRAAGGVVSVDLASVGPRNLELTGEIADGWLAIFFSPEYAGELLSSLRAGQRRAPRRGWRSTAYPASRWTPRRNGPVTNSSSWEQ